MGAAWREGEYLRLRAAAVAASASVWAVFIGEPERWRLDDLAIGAAIAAVLHAGLALSLRVEREGLPVRIVAAVAALPGGWIGARGAASFVGEWVESGVPDFGLTPFLTLFAVTCLQMWRLARLPLPGWTPLAEVRDA